MTTMNPFLVQSTLPYLAPHFDQIANHHYRPAFDEGMQQKRAEIAAIALNPQTTGRKNSWLSFLAAQYGQSTYTRPAHK